MQWCFLFIVLEERGLDYLKVYSRKAVFKKDSTLVVSFSPLIIGSVNDRDCFECVGLFALC